MTLLPLCAFPNIAYIHALLNEEVCIDLGEHFVKQTLRNKFELTGPNGRFACTMHVVKQVVPKTPITDIVLADDDWRRHTLRSIESSYGSAPFFEHYFDDVQDLISSSEKNLVKFNISALEWIESTLGVDFKLTFSKNYIDAHSDDVDLRSQMKLKDVERIGKEYPQVFEDKLGFEPNLSVLDLIFNTGPEALLFV